MLGRTVAAWLWAVSASPPAAAPSVGLEWSAPARCPAASAVRQQLARALADSAADPRGMRARASITEGADGVLTLELQLDRDDGPVGRRTMQATDCDELATAAVLIVALAVDPEARIEEPLVTPPPPAPGERADEPAEDDGGLVPLVPDDAAPSEPAPASTVPELEPLPIEPTEPEPLPPVPSERAARRSPVPTAEPLHVGLRVGASAGLSVLPRATAVVSAAAATWGRAWRVELGASYWAPVETLEGTRGARLQQWTVDARGCGLLRPGPLELPLCGGLDAGAVHGEGVGVTAPRRVASLRLALTAGAALVWRPARWGQRVGPWVGGDLLVALVRARFRATPAAPALVYYTPPVGVRVGAGLEVRFR